MVELLTLTSGTLFAGFSLYKYFTHSAHTPQPQSIRGSVPLTQPDSCQARAIADPNPHLAIPTQATEVEAAIPRAQETKAELLRAVRTSSISLGLASAGLLFFPPLRYASIPALIYMGAPSARYAYDALYEKGRPSRALAETVALAICLGGGWYLVGSLGFWLYYLGRMGQHNRSLAQTLRAPAGGFPQSARLCKGAEEVVVPTATLQQGNHVLVETSEIVPVDGVVFDGAAWLQPRAATAPSACRLVRAGDRVMAADIVIAGRLSLHVQKAD